jgi:hypothetical protein
VLPLLKLKLAEVLQAVVPLIAAACVLQVAFVHAAAEFFLRFLVGSMLTTLGMLLLFTGVDLGILPMGRFIGAELPKKGSLGLILAVAFALGFATTIAEPDVLVLSREVEAVSEGAIAGRILITVIAVGVGLFAALALLRVVWGFSMAYLLAATYSLTILLSLLSPAGFIPLAYDAGSVTTGVLTAPVVLALALGFTSVLAQRSAVSDGFGLLGFASVGPVILILLLGMLVQ